MPTSIVEGMMMQSTEPTWTIVLPYFNEAAYLVPTLKSLTEQQFRQFRLILVDNASTDGSTDLARQFMASHPEIETIFIDEPEKGKIHAMETGANAVKTEFLAFCDADTYYPPHYMAVANRILASPKADCVAVLAMDIYAEPASLGSRWRMTWRTAMTKILSHQTHTGGYGFCFRTDIFKAAGGYSTKIWDYVLEDHEIIHRILRFGKVVYDRDFWCMPSTRRSTQVAWNLREQILYHVTPYASQGWFFYKFLASRFDQRNATGLRLREKTWEPVE
jgi:glycosyltransferase involved in cell wall biosynthesis